MNPISLQIHCNYCNNKYFKAFINVSGFQNLSKFSFRNLNIRSICHFEFVFTIKAVELGGGDGVELGQQRGEWGDG